jgi:hypothetical protein
LQNDHGPDLFLGLPQVVPMTVSALDFISSDILGV